MIVIVNVVVIVIVNAELNRITLAAHIRVQGPCSYCLPGLVLSNDQVHWYYTHTAAPGTQVRAADNLL